MTEALLSTDFSEAKAHLSDLMTDVYHAHRPQLVSRHRGKEQMLLVGREDLARMLADQRLDVQVVYDEGEVTLRVPDLGILGFGDTYEEAAEDLVSELEVYASSYFQNPARYAYSLASLACGRADAVRDLLARRAPGNAVGGAGGRTLGSMRTPTFDEIEGFLRIDGWSQDRSTGHDFYEKVLPDGETLRSHTSFAGKKTTSPGRFKTILADQLKVSEAEFWEALRTRKAVEPPQPSAAAGSRGRFRTG